jgi:hypothetical protein
LLAVPQLGQNFGGLPPEEPKNKYSEYKVIDHSWGEKKEEERRKRKEKTDQNKENNR